MQAHVFEPVFGLQVLLQQDLAQHALEHQGGGQDGDLPVGDVIRKPFIEAELNVISKTFPAVFEEIAGSRVLVEQTLQLDT